MLLSWLTAARWLLDEIGEYAPRRTQAKLLRVLEDHKVAPASAAKWKRQSTCACWPRPIRKPEQAVAKGELRQDLLFPIERISHSATRPCREHKEDIPLLVGTYFAVRSMPKHGRHVRGVNPEVLDLFASYSWPGNVRELRNVLERGGHCLRPRFHWAAPSLPADFGHAPAAAASDLASLRFPLGTTGGKRPERELILQTLSSHEQQDTPPAELLGISLKTLHNKLKEYEAAKSSLEMRAGQLMQLRLKTKITLTTAALVLAVVGVNSTPLRDESHAAGNPGKRTIAPNLFSPAGFFF